MSSVSESISGKVPNGATVVIGLQFGDEGKARVVDDLAAEHDIIARFNGGANAGHTIEHNGVKLALKQVPAGVFHEGKILYLGSGCVLNMVKLRTELESLKQAGIDVSDRFRISSQAGLIQPHHILLDTLIGGSVGTTRNGIGPAYADRALRMWGDRLLNIRVGDLLQDAEAVFALLQANLDAAKKMYGMGEELGRLVEGEIQAMREALPVIADFVEIDPLYVQKMADAGKRVLFEGAQAFMLDVNKGSVPYVTSSHTSAAAAYIGGDLPPSYHGRTVGVAKVIMSRVGHGPFVSEFGGARSEEYCMSLNADGSPVYGKAVEAGYDIEGLLRSDDDFEMSKAVRHLSGEYGTVTTRPRRVGAVDLVQLKTGVMANGVKELILTKCDLLNVYARTKNGKIPVVKEYRLDGKSIDFVPGSTALLKRVEPVFSWCEGFSEDISGVREAAGLPAALMAFVKEVEAFVGCRVVGLGVGPGREQYVSLK